MLAVGARPKAPGRGPLVIHPRYSRDLIAAYMPMLTGERRWRNLWKPGQNEYGSVSAQRPGPWGPLAKEIAANGENVQFPSGIADNESFFTVMVWSYPDNPGYVLRGYDSAAAAHYAYSVVLETGTFAVVAGGTQYTSAMPVTAPTGKLEQLTGVYSQGLSVQAFKNGVPGAVVVPANLLRTDDALWRLGYDNNAAWTDSAYGGLLCWRRVLSRDEIQSLYLDPWRLFSLSTRRTFVLAPVKAGRLKRYNGTSWSSKPTKDLGGTARSVKRYDGAAWHTLPT